MIRLNARTAQKLTREWQGLTRQKKETVLNKLFAELTPDQQNQVNSFLHNYKDGIDYAFNYAVNALTERTTESARTPATHAGWREKKCL